jgi:hypothetical protein
LKRLIDHCKGGASDLNHNVTTKEDDEPFMSNLFNQEDSTIFATFPRQKLDPVYISLYINRRKLSNCIIDIGASDNVMPFPIAKALGLTLTKVHGRCYSMDAKKVSLLGKIKDAQVALASHPKKILLLTILVVDIPASYSLLLSRSFCRDLGGKIKLDWSQAIIPIGSKKVKLGPDKKEKFTVLKLDDPKAQILYQELEFGNYMLFTEDTMNEQEIEDKESSSIWKLEFDGSFSSSGCGAGVVLIPPKGEPKPMAFKLEFGNTNNTVEYEALLLGIIAAKVKGIKILKA